MPAYKVVHCMTYYGNWRVEDVSDPYRGTPSVLVATFSSRERAEEYAAWKNAASILDPETVDAGAGLGAIPPYGDYKEDDDGD